MNKIFLFFLLQFLVISSFAQSDSEIALTKAKEAIKLMDEGKIDKSIELLEESQKLDSKNYIYPYEIAYAYVLKKEEGGRHTPFFKGYRPQFYFRTTDVTGDGNLTNAEMCMPGDNVELEVKLITPIAMDEHQRFAIREGGRTIGSGTVTSIEE